MIILGVDGGGTKTHALALDEHGNTIGVAIGGPSTYHGVGLENAAVQIAEVSSAALNGNQADIAVYCLGDCDSALDESRLSTAIAPLHLARQSIFYNDTFAALRAGTSRPYGAAVICGTGFNACGIAPNGKTTKLYALGPMTGDWGGGISLSTEMFSAIYRANDGRGKPTLLTSLLLDALNAPNLAVLADWLANGEIEYTRIVSSIPLLFEAAEAGDEVSRAIILRQADEIASAAQAILRALAMDSLDVDVTLAGGVVYGKGEILMNRVIAQLQATCPQARVARLTVAPVIGAALLGFDRLNVAVPRAIEQIGALPSAPHTAPNHKN